MTERPPTTVHDEQPESGRFWRAIFRNAMLIAIMINLGLAIWAEAVNGEAFLSLIALSTLMTIVGWFAGLASATVED